MFSYVIRLLVGAVLVIVFASMLVFGLFFFGPSDPGRVLCDAASGRCTPERAEQINDSLGFNDPRPRAVRRLGEGHLHRA